MKKVLISGSYGTGNVGDEVILKYILSVLNRHEICILSQGLDYTKKYFLNGPVTEVVDQTPSWRPTRILKDIIKLKFGLLWQRLIFIKKIIACDIFWVGGGGLFAELIPTVLEYYLHQIKIAHFFGKKVVIMGVGVGPLRTREGIKNITHVFQHIPEYIAVRDQQSYLNLISNGVSRAVHVAPDFAFLTEPRELVNQMSKKKVIFNFYPAFSDPVLHPDGGARFNQLKEGIISITQELIGLGYEVVYLPFGTKNDLRFSKLIEQEVAHPSCHTFQSDSYEEIIHQLSQGSFSITMRFHAGLISMLNNIPSICIDQQFKSERLLKDFGREDLLYSLPDGHHKEGKEDLTWNQMKPKIDYLVSHYEDIQRSFHTYHKTNRDKLMTMVQEMKLQTSLEDKE